MATEEVTEKDLESLQSKNEKLANEVAEAERKIAEQQQQASLLDNKQRLEREGDALQAKLAALKDQLKAAEKAPTPTEQAEAARKADTDAVNQPAGTDVKEGK